MTRAGRCLLGAGLALATVHLPAGPAADRWQRTNYRGREVTLRSGPALAFGVVAAGDLPAPALTVAVLGAAAVGRYDDLVGGRTGQAGVKGLAGHLAALRAGRVTAGTVKVVGIGLAAVVASAALPDTRGDRAWAALLGGAVVAGTANLVNLLDLRPGRALKAGLVAALALRRPGTACVAAALLPGDLAERSMLGDAGANALGAVLGLALVEGTGRPGRVTALALLTALTALSEVVSYSRLIDAVPPLRWADRLGRRP